MLRRSRSIVLAGMFLMLSSGASYASAILSPVAVTENTMGEASPGDLLAAINHNGLLTDFVSGVTDFDTYIAGNPLHTWVYDNTEWYSDFDVRAGRLGFDLGANYSINRIAFWNEELNGTDSFGLFGSLANSFVGSTPLGTFFPTDNPAVYDDETNEQIGADYAADVFAFSAMNARYLWLTPTTAQGYWGVAFGEIAFSANPPTGEAVPEPATLTLVGVGVAVVAFRRRRRAVTSE